MSPVQEEGEEPLGDSQQHHEALAQKKKMPSSETSAWLSSVPVGFPGLLTWTRYQ